jgi:hypothetical protein
VIGQQVFVMLDNTPAISPLCPVTLDKPCLARSYRQQPTYRLSLPETIAEDAIQLSDGIRRNSEVL